MGAGDRRVPESTRALSDLRLTAERADRRESFSLRPPRSLRLSLLLRRAARDENLLGVPVRVLSVDFQPALGRVPAAVLCVGAAACPVRLGHPPENLTGCPPRGLEGVERRLDRPIVEQTPCEFVLIVALDLR